MLKVLRLALLLHAMLSLGLVPSAHAADVESSFDFSKAHTFLGFGAQVWLNSRDPEPGLQLLRDTHARYVRVSMVPKFTLSQLRADMTVQEALRVIKANDSSEQRQRFIAFRDQMKRQNIAIQLIFWRMPEPWVRTESQRAGSKERSHFAKAEFIDSYVNVIVAQMAYLAELGVEVEAVELTNEPHGAWGTKFTRDDYAHLVISARTVMDRQGLERIKIAGPGANLKQFDHFIGALQERKAVASLGYVSGHVYESVEDLAELRGPLGSFFGRGRFGPIMITEYGNRPEPGLLAGWGDEADIASPEYALNAAAKSVLLLSHGASGLLFWQLQDFAWNQKRHGLLSESGKRLPVAQAMVALFGPLPPGAKVVGASQPVMGLFTVALQSEDKSYAVVVNLGDRSRSWAARLQGGHSHCGRVVDVSGFQTSGDGRNALRNLKVEDCSLRADVSPGTVATVVMQ